MSADRAADRQANGNLSAMVAASKTSKGPDHIVLSDTRRSLHTSRRTSSRPTGPQQNRNNMSSSSSSGGPATGSGAVWSRYPSAAALLELVVVDEDEHRLA